jgi:phosphate uptake regulator
MEKRKIIKFGNSSYVITLPNEWLEKNKLDKGDTVYLNPFEDTIVIKSKLEKDEKRATINLNKKPLKLFNKELISYYLKNYKFIEIIGDNLFEKLDQIKVFQEKLSSVEIVELSEEKIVLKDLTSPESLDINSLFEELIEMEKLLIENLITIFKEKDSKKQSFINMLDKNINKLTFLAYKAINYNLDNINDSNLIRDSIYFWRMISSFEQIGDILKRIGRYVISCKDFNSDKLIPILIELKDYFNFITSLYKVNTNLEKNLEVYLDKKQSLLRSLENIKSEYQKDINTFLVIQQLLKDTVGQLDIIILSIIDINH